MIKTREATLGDAADIARVLRESRQAAMPWLPNPYAPEDDLRFIQAIVLPRKQTFVAEQEGRIIGFISIADDWIEHLYITPEERRRGVGSLLIETVMPPTGPLQLWVFQRNAAARRFYEALGFRAVEYTDGSRNAERTPDVRYLRGDRSQILETLRYREMTVEDVASALEMRTTTLENAITLERLETDYAVTESALIRSMQTHVRGWLCQQEDIVVGFAMGDRSNGEVQVVAVRPGFEGLQIGQTLLNRGRDWLFAEGHSQIWLAANPDNAIRAHGFYRHLGWRLSDQMRGEDEIMVMDRQSSI